MKAPELHLAAALRDANSENARARNIAVRSLADAYIFEVLGGKPTWQSLDCDARGEQVREHLRLWCSTQSIAQERAWALLGAGKLGEWPALSDEIRHALELIDDSPAAVLVRECAVLAANELLQLPRGNAPRDAWPQLAELLTESLTHAAPEVRYQSAQIIGEQPDLALADALLRAIQRETDDRVLAGQARAASEYLPQHEAIRRALLELASRSSTEESAFAASIALTSRRIACSQVALREALVRRDRQDQALEALAYAGRDLDAPTRAAVETLADTGRFASVTRVRAAYCLAACPQTRARGHFWLSRFAASWRPAIRESVRQALALLAAQADRP